MSKPKPSPQVLRFKMGLEEAMTMKVEVPIAIKLLEKFGRDITKRTQCQAGHYALFYTKRGDALTYRSSARGSPV